MGTWPESTEVLQRLLQAKGGASIAGTPRHATRRGPTAATTALEQAWAIVQALAEAHGWTGEDAWTYITPGTDTSLHLWLQRGTTLIRAEMTSAGAATPAQQAWLQALAATGKVEVYVWSARNLTEITTRLSAPDC